MFPRANQDMEAHALEHSLPDSRRASTVDEAMPFTAAHAAAARPRQGGARAPNAPQAPRRGGSAGVGAAAAVAAAGRERRSSTQASVREERDESGSDASAEAASAGGGAAGAAAAPSRNTGAATGKGRAAASAAARPAANAQRRPGARRASRADMPTSDSAAGGDPRGARAGDAHPRNARGSDAGGSSGGGSGGAAARGVAQLALGKLWEGARRASAGDDASLPPSSGREVRGRRDHAPCMRVPRVVFLLLQFDSANQQAQQTHQLNDRTGTMQTPRAARPRPAATTAPPRSAGTRA